MQKLSNKISICFFLIGFFLINRMNAQSFQQDYLKIANADFNDYTYKESSPSFLLPDSKNIIVKYNPVSLVMSSMMYVYQLYFSKQISAGCLFNPSCSNMSKQLIKEFGLVKGVFLSADRLTRCNRIAATDVHAIRINPADQKIHENAKMFRVKSKTTHKHD